MLKYIICMHSFICHMSPTWFIFYVLQSMLEYDFKLLRKKNLKKRSFKEFFLISKRNNKRPNDRDQVWRAPCQPKLYFLILISLNQNPGSAIGWSWWWVQILFSHLDPDIAGRPSLWVFVSVIESWRFYYWCFCYFIVLLFIFQTLVMCHY